MEGSRADQEKKRADCGESMRDRQRTREEVALQAGKGREQSRPQSGGPSTSATIECGEEAAKHFAFERGYINLNHGEFCLLPQNTWPSLTITRRIIRHSSHRRRRSASQISGPSRSKTRHFCPLRIPLTSPQPSTTSNRRLCPCSSRDLRPDSERYYRHRHYLAQPELRHQ